MKTYIFFTNEERENIEQILKEQGYSNIKYEYSFDQLSESYDNESGILYIEDGQDDEL